MRITQLNFVSLRGTVGEVKPIMDRGRIYGFRFQFVTNLLYRNLEGYDTIETTWHTCQYYDLKGETGLIKKGDPLEVIGRLHQFHFTRSDGEEGVSYDIVVKQINKINGPLEPQEL